MGGPSSGNILVQDWYNQVQDCVYFLNISVYICYYGYWFVVSIVTLGYIKNCVHFVNSVTWMDWVVLPLVN